MEAIIQILRRFLETGDEAGARALLAGQVDPTDGDQLTRDQIDVFIREAASRVETWDQNLAREAADFRQVQIPGNEGEDLARRLFGETPTGRRAFFQREVDSTLPGGASSFLRNALERRFNPIDAAFRLRSGLGFLPSVTEGDVERAQGFGEYFTNPAREFPGDSEYRSLLSQAANLLLQKEDTLGDETHADVQRKGFWELLRGEPERQYQLALQGAIRGVSPRLQEAYARVSRRQFNASRLKNPDLQFLPQFVQRGSFSPGAGI